MKINAKLGKNLMTASLSTGLLLVLTQAVQAGYYDHLSPDEQAEIRAGHQVVKEQEISGDPWPQFTIYQKINATAFESAAVFCDFNRHHEYFPGIVSSEVTETQPGGHLTLNYRIQMMGQSDDTTVKEWVHKVDSSYRVDWKLASSRLAELSDGFAVFEPLGNAGESALLVYSDLIKPNSSVPSFLLGMFKKKVENEIRDSVSAIEGRVHALKADASSSADPVRSQLLAQEQDQLSKLLQ